MILTGQIAFSASMNSYLTSFLLRRRPSLFLVFLALAADACSHVARSSAPNVLPSSADPVSHRLRRLPPAGPQRLTAVSGRSISRQMTPMLLSLSRHRRTTSALYSNANRRRGRFVIRTLSPISVLQRMSTKSGEAQTQRTPSRSPTPPAAFARSPMCGERGGGPMQRRGTRQEDLPRARAPARLKVASSVLSRWLGR